MAEENVSTMTGNPDVTQPVELLNRRWLSETAFEIEISRPPFFNFKAGQTIVLIHESIRRYYSLISGPDDPTLSLCVQYIPGGRLSSVLANTEIGLSLKLSGPHGYFTFIPSARRPVFVSTGTGIAPFVCFARSGVTDFTLFQQAMSVDDLYYQSIFNKITSKYFTCFPAAPLLPDAFCGTISDCIRENLRRGRYDFYLCGEREMLCEVMHLVDEQYSGSRVYSEVFY
jgi:ferredoxin-NADP reductase